MQNPGTSRLSGCRKWLISWIPFPVRWWLRATAARLFPPPAPAPAPINKPAVDGDMNLVLEGLLREMRRLDVRLEILRELLEARLPEDGASAAWRQRNAG